MTKMISKPSPQKISTGGVKKGRNEGQKVITANRLSDGVVVYRGLDGVWTENIAMAHVVEGEMALSLLADAIAEETLVVGPYLMDIHFEAGAVSPTGRGQLRETIRDLGPTIHPEFGRQATQRERVQDPIHVSV